MRTNYIYMILLMVGMLFSCQRPELSDSDTSPRPEGGNGEEVTLTFSALLPSSPSTKAMGDEPSFGEDIKSMHLVLFDENGMLVETREATILENGLDHDSDIKDKYGNLVPHLYEASFKVTLTVTDRPRTIHFIANCPVDQIAYGHEISIIGNLYVEKDGDSTTPETAYWARVEVPYINYKEVEVEGEKHYVPVDEIQPYFRCVPMLRNFAQVVVTDATGDTDPFRFMGFSVYNTIDIGTIAPYNNTTQKFQSFLDTDGSKYSYPELTALNYKGHALAAAELNTELPKDANGNVIFYEEYDPADPDDPKTIFYMYERKISARTDQEELWDESPPHVIVKGDYNGKTYYYKVDLVYDIVDDNGTPEDKTDDIVTDIEYYNILRNFRYQFTITEVSGKGYDTIEEAIQGSTSNNLSGSSTTSKFTNISDTKGRLWVSYTDTTLVTSDKITLKYKYVPDLGDLDSNNEPKINNALAGNGGLITLENLTGDVIKSYEVASTDITEGSWAGYREITLTINDPGNTIKEQTIAVKTNNANLGRDVRFYLRQKFPLEIECTPKVASEVGIPVELDIKLPVGLTDDLFPLDLAIEVYDMTLSPDATKNTLPVETGMSVIPLPEKENKTTFHFIKTIETRSEYDALTTVGNRKIFTTYWLTNKIDNESTIYVVNKYFNVASDNFINAKAFSNLAVNPNPIREGTGRKASITFTMDARDDDFASRNVKVKLYGLADSQGRTEFTYIPTTRTVTIDNLLTTDATGSVSFTIEEENYALSTATAGRRRGFFSNMAFSEETLKAEIGTPVTFDFSLSDYDPGMTVNVELDGLAPSDGDLTAATRADITNWTYKPNDTNCSFDLMTTLAGDNTCRVRLSADGFDTSEWITIEQSNVKEEVIPRNRTISGTLSGVPNNPNAQNGCTATITIEGNNAFTATCDVTRSRNTYSYTITITTSHTVRYTPGQKATISLRFRKNSSDYYIGTFDVEDLINGNLTNVILTHQ